MFCMFGAHLDKRPNRFQRMALTHPRQHEFCINKLGCGKVLDYIGVPYQPQRETEAAMPAETHCCLKKAC